MLVDTDVLIWYLRGVPTAKQRLDRLSNLTLSALTWLELLQGCRSRNEMLAMQQSFEMRNANRLPLTPPITDRATSLMESFTLSHGLQLGDALIAATALEYGLTVLTCNVKHFGPLPGITIEHFEP